MKDAKSRLSNIYFPNFILYIISKWLENIIHLYKLLANYFEIPSEISSLIFRPIDGNWRKINCLRDVMLSDYKRRTHNYLSLIKVPPTIFPKINFGHFLSDQLIL